MPANESAARPSTAPAPSSTFTRTAQPRRAKAHKSLAASTEEVNKLFNATAASFQER